jgi:hypothetical protein
MGMKKGFVRELPIERLDLDYGEGLVATFDDLCKNLSEEEVEEEKLLNLQLTMATTSINHEYARIEFDKSDDYEKKEELLKYMAACRHKYLKAREELAKYSPAILEAFEKDLNLQKLSTITVYHA